MEIGLCWVVLVVEAVVEAVGVVGLEAEEVSDGV